jgi:hypothetical protein
MGDIGDRLDVEHLQHRIGRAFQEEGFGVRPHGLAPLVEVGAVDQGRSDAVAREVLFDDVKAGAEHRLRRHDMIAGPDLTHQRGCDRRHPGCGRARGLRALERGDALFEHRNRGIGEAGILITRLLVLEALFRA